MQIPVITNLHPSIYSKLIVIFPPDPKSSSSSQTFFSIGMLNRLVGLTSCFSPNICDDTDNDSCMYGSLAVLKDGFVGTLGDSGSKDIVIPPPPVYVSHSLAGGAR